MIKRVDFYISTDGLLWLRLGGDQLLLQEEKNKSNKEHSGPHHSILYFLHIGPNIL